MFRHYTLALAARGASVHAPVERRSRRAEKSRPLRRSIAAGCRPVRRSQLRLDNSLSTNNHDGDGSTATVADNVYAQDGSIAVPAGAVLHGTVTGRMARRCRASRT